MLQIDEKEYKNLVKADVTLDLFVSTMLKTAELSYNGKRLMFNDDVIARFLESTFEESYAERMDVLKAEKEAENGDNDI